MRRVLTGGLLEPTVGGSVSFSGIPNRLEQIYGRGSGFGVALFVSVRPAPMAMSMPMPPMRHQSPQDTQR